MTVKGTEELNKVVVGIQAFSKRALQAAKATARTEMTSLRGAAIARTPVDTGKARGSWSSVIEAGDTMYFELDVPYGHALDKGSEPGSAPWPSVGPRTALYKGRIFSSQVADGEGGIVAEVFNEARKGQIADAILNTVQKELTDALG